MRARAVGKTSQRKRGNVKGMNLKQESTERVSVVYNPEHEEKDGRGYTRRKTKGWWLDGWFSVRRVQSERGFETRVRKCAAWRIREVGRRRATADQS